MEATKLSVSDDWGRLIYTFRGERVDEHRGGTAEVFWPDGTREAIAYVSRGQRVQVWDHGKPYWVTRRRLMGVVAHRGFTLEVDLAELRLGRLTVDAD